MSSPWLCLFIRFFMIFLLFICLIEFCQAGGSAAGSRSSSPTRQGSEVAASPPKKARKPRHRKQSSTDSKSSGTPGAAQGHKKQPSADSKSSGSSTSSKKKTDRIKESEKKQSERSENLDKQSFVESVNSEASGMWEATKYEWIAKLRDAQKSFFTGVKDKLNEWNKERKWNKRKQQKEKGKAREESPVGSGGGESSGQAKTTTTTKGKWTCTEHDEFDVRTIPKWADCRSVFKRIEAQGLCGACWAVAATAVFSDRYCIKNIKNAKERGKHFSAMDVLTCMKDEGGKVPGCKGEQPESALGFIAQHGVVTSACKPLYTAMSATSLVPVYMPKCKMECVESSGLKYSEDKREGCPAINWKGSTEDGKSGDDYMAQIETQIREIGPVVASFDTYMDFMFYKRGVYTRSRSTINRHVGYHAVRIIGWGTQTCIRNEGAADPTKKAKAKAKEGDKKEEKHKYWIVANSWGANWGEHGFFKIRKGVDECGIESYGVVFSRIPTTIAHHQASSAAGVLAGASGSAGKKGECGPESSSKDGKKRDKSPSSSVKSDKGSSSKQGGKEQGDA